MRSVLFLSGIIMLGLLGLFLLFPPHDKQTIFATLGFIGSVFVIATLIVPKTR